MSVNIKHIATFLLGAAAGAALMKYNSMTPEEQEKMMQKLKDQANKLKDEAEKAAETAKGYMSELHEKGKESLKDYMGQAEKNFQDIFNQKPDEPKAV
jgi:chromosome segregation ATPase